VFGTAVTCRPHGGTYIEYGFFGGLAVLALCTLVLAATASQVIALAVGAIAGLLYLWRIARTGMGRDSEELVVVNLFRTYRVPLRDIRGYRFPPVSFSFGKQSGVLLILKAGGRVQARMLDYGAGEWLEAQGLVEVSRKDSSRDHRT
jgi:hypothetical protein